MAHRITVSLLFIILGFGLSWYGRKLIKENRKVWGKNPIMNVDFIMAKISVFMCWGLFLFKVINYKFGYFDVPVFQAWIGTGILTLSVVIMILSFKELGTSLKVGLPEEPTELRTSGIYRYSRHPLYLGAFLCCFASCIYFPDLMNVFFFFYGLYYHVKIINAEERFLEQRFGEEWRIYKYNVRKFI